MMNILRENSCTCTGSSEQNDWEYVEVDPWLLCTPRSKKERGKKKKCREPYNTPQEINFILIAKDPEG